MPQEVLPNTHIAVSPAQEAAFYDISPALVTAVYEAMGTASMCWLPRPGDCVFQSEEAIKVAQGLLAKIAEELTTARKC